MKILALIIVDYTIYFSSCDIFPLSLFMCKRQLAQPLTSNVILYSSGDLLEAVRNLLRRGGCLVTPRVTKACLGLLMAKSQALVGAEL